jgi:hypothetical protein
VCVTQFGDFWTTSSSNPHWSLDPMEKILHSSNNNAAVPLPTGSGGTQNICSSYDCSAKCISLVQLGPTCPIATLNQSAVSDSITLIHLFPNRGPFAPAFTPVHFPGRGWPLAVPTSRNIVGLVI